MSKRHKHPPVNLADFKAKKAEEGQIPVIAGDRTFYIKSPLTLSDDDFRTLTSGDDPIASARLLVDDYDGFVAAGGSAALVGAIVNDVDDLGEDEASSGS